MPGHQVLIVLKSAQSVRELRIKPGVFLLLNLIVNVLIKCDEINEPRRRDQIVLQVPIIPPHRINRREIVYCNGPNQPGTTGQSSNISHTLKKPSHRPIPRYSSIQSYRHCVQ
jgi:hypothetical protein